MEEGNMEKKSKKRNKSKEMLKRYLAVFNPILFYLFVKG